MDPTVEMDPITPSFLYATDGGELRVMHVDITEEDGGDTTYTVKRHSNIGLSQRNFGLVTTEYDGAYDWSSFREGEDPRVVAVLQRENRLDPTHQTEYEKQFAFINRFKSIRQMEFFSELNQRTQELREYNYWSAGRTVSFIDDRYYLAYWTDVYDSDSGVPRPGLPPNHQVSHMMMYDSEESSQNDPEILASTLAGGYASRHPDNHWVSNFSNTRVFGTANSEFYILWTPVRLSTGLSPYFFRFDGTTAYDPREAGGSQAYNRLPGQESFSIDTHPSRDSLIVVSDHNSRHKSTYILELGSSSNQPMNVVAELPFNDNRMQLNNPDFSWGDVNADARSWYVEFSPDGDKVAIIQAIEGEDPSVIIWDWDETGDDDVEVYSISGGDDVVDIRKPAWLDGEDNEEHTNLLYFMARHEGPGNDDENDEENGADRAAYFHYIDTDIPTHTQSQSRRIDWGEHVEFRDMTDDPAPEEPQNLKGRH